MEFDLHWWFGNLIGAAGSLEGQSGFVYGWPLSWLWKWRLTKRIGTLRCYQIPPDSSPSGMLNWGQKQHLDSSFGPPELWLSEQPLLSIETAYAGQCSSYRQLITWSSSSPTSITSPSAMSCPQVRTIEPVSFIAFRYTCAPLQFSSSQISQSRLYSSAVQPYLIWSHPIRIRSSFHCQILADGFLGSTWGFNELLKGSKVDSSSVTTSGLGLPFHYLHAFVALHLPSSHFIIRHKLNNLGEAQPVNTPLLRGGFWQLGSKFCGLFYLFPSFSSKFRQSSFSLICLISE